MVFERSPVAPVSVVPSSVELSMASRGWTPLLSPDSNLNSASIFGLDVPVPRSNKSLSKSGLLDSRNFPLAACRTTTGLRGSESGSDLSTYSAAHKSPTVYDIEDSSKENQLTNSSPVRVSKAPNVAIPAVSQEAAYVVSMILEIRLIRFVGPHASRIGHEVVCRQTERGRDRRHGAHPGFPMSAFDACNRGATEVRGGGKVVLCPKLGRACVLDPLCKLARESAPK